MSISFSALGSRLRQSASYLWLIAAAVYLGVSAGQTVLRSYASKQEISDLQQKLANAQLEKQRLQALIVYYNTDGFKEKELRRAMLLAMPNETVYALPESNHNKSLEDEVTSPDVTKATTKTVSNEPNWKLWWEYLMHRSA